MDVDVAIVGGGPAGAAAALTLRRYTGRSVVLIERSSYGELRIGETVSNALKPLLEYLGVSQVLSGEHRIEGLGAKASWGSSTPSIRHSIFLATGQGWHLNRLAFDRALASAAEDRGATVLRNAPLKQAALVDGIWRLRLGGNISHEIIAPQMVDATGRAAVVARRAGARHRAFDKLVGLTGVFRVSPAVPIENMIFVEAVENGWWYSASAPANLAVVTYMTDADILPYAARDRYLDLLRGAPLTAKRLHGCQLDSRPRVFPSCSQVLEPCLGAVGSLLATRRAPLTRCRPSVSGMPWLPVFKPRGLSKAGLTAKKTSHWPIPAK